VPQASHCSCCDVVSSKCIVCCARRWISLADVTAGTDCFSRGGVGSYESCSLSDERHICGKVHQVPTVGDPLCDSRKVLVFGVPVADIATARRAS
jgi:hypothetical protein